MQRSGLTNFKIISKPFSEAPNRDGVIFAGKTFIESDHDPDKHSESHPGHIPSTVIGYPISSSAQSITIMRQHSAGLHDKHKLQCTNKQHTVGLHDSRSAQTSAGMTQHRSAYMTASAKSSAVKTLHTVGSYDSQCTDLMPS